MFTSLIRVADDGISAEEIDLQEPGNNNNNTNNTNNSRHHNTCLIKIRTGSSMKLVRLKPQCSRAQISIVLLNSEQVLNRSL